MIALCGCGNMGSAIAARLALSDDGLVVFDVDGGRAETLAAELSARAATSLAAVAAQARAVVLSLPSETVSRRVVGELVEHLPAGAVVIETSTVNPSDMQALEPLCADAGVALVDAAVLSGVAQMREGRSLLLVGGSDDAVAAARHVLDLIAPRQLRLGPLGAGMAAKVANNGVSHAVMVVLLEATAMAAGAGVPPEVFAELLSDPDAGLLRPLAHRLRERVFDEDYEGGMPTEAARKDSVLALRLAQETGVPLYAIQAAHTVYELAVAAGYGRDDYAAVARLWEGWTGRPLRSADGR